MTKELNKNNYEMKEEITKVEEEFNKSIDKLHKKKMSHINYNLKESELNSKRKNTINEIKNKYKQLNKIYHPIKLTVEEKDFGWEEKKYIPGWKHKCEEEYRRWKKEDYE